MHADRTAARAVEIGDQEERQRNHNRQHEQKQFALATLAIADQKVTGNRHQRHHRPGAGGNPVPPRRLGKALRVDGGFL